ncbi:LacI family DNA-binding transcriptional regulator [Bremerella alba]|uniref:Ribose operon repressor n=1 Tax=Bremerella alba TaxID=980252 RepID=A0A7V8V3J6_9BACT|nr:LacI family DNA-binding transcriptional regulator [Bremerella alba]MBA2114131.1 Ribose operon repressor [Bremerella alba]
MANTVEIAEAAGVSQATVSRVINNQSGVAPETVQLVRDMIKRLGYQPRPRKARKSSEPVKPPKNVAVVMLDESCQRHPTLAMAKLKGVQQALAIAGMNMILADVSSGEVNVPAIAQKQLDGVLLWGHRGSKELLDKLQGIPAVWLSSHVSSTDSVVSQGNAAIGQLAGEYLLKQNHTNLCFLTVHSDHPGFAARGDGFGYAVHLAGHEIRRFQSEQDVPFEKMSSQQLEESLALLVETMLAEMPRPIGLFLPDDQITATVYRLLQRANVEVGRDIEIVSCNNEEPYLAGLHPRPATIDLGPELTGRRAVEQLLWNIRQPQLSGRRVELIVEPILIDGESLADFS